MLNQIAISFSSNKEILAGNVGLIPKGFTLIAYENVIKDRQFINSFKNTVLYTICCTLIQMLWTMITAYPLSRKKLKGRNAILTILIFSMMFGTGGLIPNYMLVANLGLLNSYWALILPGAVNIWNVILFKNFFQQMPESLEEAARVDGAGIFRTFLVIVLPLSKPSIAAIGLFTAVNAWSTYFEALLYITDRNKKLLQVYLSSVLQASIKPDSPEMIETGVNNIEAIANGDALKAACMICTVVPIMLVYPFLQKYFVSGLMVGSVKG